MMSAAQIHSFLGLALPDFETISGRNKHQAERGTKTEGEGRGHRAAFARVVVECCSSSIVYVKALNRKAPFESVDSSCCLY